MHIPIENCKVSDIQMCLYYFLSMALDWANSIFYWKVQGSTKSIMQNNFLFFFLFSLYISLDSQKIKFIYLKNRLRRNPGSKCNFQALSYKATLLTEKNKERQAYLLCNAKLTLRI